MGGGRCAATDVGAEESSAAPPASAATARRSAPSCHQGYARLLASEGAHQLDGGATSRP